MIRTTLAAGVCALLLLGATPARADSDVTRVIYEEAARAGISGDWLYAVAYCESTLNPQAVGKAGERGVMQWHPRGLWWDTPAGRAGQPIPVGDIRLDIAMGAWAFAHGLSSHWTCAR